MTLQPALSAAPAAEDPRWDSVVARDTSADGTFFYSVRTTGVYCRPSCASRRARRENVAFHATRADAERAGFRPCKRCRPDQPTLQERHARTIAAVCRRIAKSEEPPRLAELAAIAKMSPYHFHRVFKAVTGLTPKAYADAHRAGRVREELVGGASVTEALFDAGFNSSGRFYDRSNAILGMTPGRYRDGGRDTRIRFAVGECSLGSILVAATGAGVCAISLGDDADRLVRELQDRFPNAVLVGDDEAFAALVARVTGFVEEPAGPCDLPLDVRGTAFQQRVWRALSAIPPGETVSYADLARRIGRPGSARAVAGACAANPLAVAIPCHRVVRRDGNLSGYRWGVERKRDLLRREARSSGAR